MNWTRIKNLFFATFMVVNVLLSYMVVSNIYWSSDAYKLTSKYESEVIRLIERRGIKVDVKIPRTISFRQNIVLSYKEMDIEKIKNVFFDDDELVAASYSFLEDAHIYEYKHKRLELSSGRRIFYSTRRNPIPYQGTDESARDLVIGKLIRLGFEASDLEITRHENIGGLHRIEISQRLRGHYLDGGSRIIATIDNEGLYSLASLWFLVIDESDTTAKVLPAIEALMSLIHFEGSAIVEGLEIGYFLPADLGDFVGFSQSDDWKYITRVDAIPAWRITLNGNRRVYIDSFTGRIIGEQY